MEKIKIETHNADTLTPEELNEIVDCGQSAFGSTMSASEVIEHVQGNITIARDGDTIIGFGATEERGADELYIGAIAVSEEHQGQGVGAAIGRAQLDEAVNGVRDTVSVRTQNIAVETNLTERLDELVDAGSVTGYEIERTLVPGLYGRELAEHTPEPPSGDPYAALDREAGDAYIVVINVKYE